MSTRPRPRNFNNSSSNFSLGGADDDLSDAGSGHMGSNHMRPSQSTGSLAKRGKSPKKIERRPSRVHRSPSHHGSLLLSTLEHHESFSSDGGGAVGGNNDSFRNIMNRPSGSGRASGRASASEQRRRHRSSRSPHRNGLNNGSSHRGGEKERAAATEDDNWKIFREALQNMA